MDFSTTRGPIFGPVQHKSHDTYLCRFWSTRNKLSRDFKLFEFRSWTSSNNWRWTETEIRTDYQSRSLSIARTGSKSRFEGHVIINFSFFGWTNIETACICVAWLNLSWIKMWIAANMYICNVLVDQKRTPKMGLRNYNHQIYSQFMFLTLWINRFWANSCCATVSCCSEPSSSCSIQLNRVFWSTFILIRTLIPIEPVNSKFEVVDNVMSSALARIHSKPDMIRCSIFHEIGFI